MKTSLEGAHDQHFKCTEAEMLQAKGTDCFWIRCSHLAHMSCTKLHGDITIAILAENYPKIIYDMMAFEFATSDANSTKARGLSAKLARHAFVKGSGD